MRHYGHMFVAGLSIIVSPVAAMDSGQTYVAIQGGVTQPESHDFSLGSGARVDTELKDGYVVIGAVGRKFGNVRAEVEASYRSSEVDEHSTGGTTLAGSVGDLHVAAAMANMYYDIPTSAIITPYIGGGIGVANVEHDGYATTANGVVLDEGNTAFAYQGMAGLAAPVSARLSLNAEYRYFATEDLVVHSGTRQSNTNYNSHNVLVGARYAF